MYWSGPVSRTLNAPGSHMWASHPTGSYSGLLSMRLWKLSTLSSWEPARVGSLLSRKASAEGVQLLIPVSPKRSWNGSGSVSALAAGALASPISAAAKAALTAVPTPPVHRRLRLRSCPVSDEKR